MLFFHLTNEPASSLVDRNDRCSRRTSPSEAYLSNKSLFHNDDKYQTYLQYDEKRYGKMSKKIQLVVPSEKLVSLKKKI